MDMVANAYYTAEMVKDLPDDGNRYETVHGELFVTPAPTYRHQEIVIRLVEPIQTFLKRNNVGHLSISPANIEWGHDTLVQPDLFVSVNEEAEKQDWAYIKTLLLVIEVLSPSSIRRDRIQKRELYQSRGIPTYWIVNPDDRSIEVWTPEDSAPTVCTETVKWKPEGASKPLTIKLKELFQGL